MGLFVHYKQPKVLVVKRKKGKFLITFVKS